MTVSMVTSIAVLGVCSSRHPLSTVAFGTGRPRPNTRPFRPPNVLTAFVVVNGHHLWFLGCWIRPLQLFGLGARAAPHPAHASANSAAAGILDVAALRHVRVRCCRGLPCDPTVLRSGARHRRRSLPRSQGRGRPGLRFGIGRGHAAAVLTFLRTGLNTCLASPSPTPLPSSW